MKFEDDSQRVVDHAEKALELTGEDVLADARAHSPRLTGRYAGTLGAAVSKAGDVVTVGFVTPLIYGPTVEFGANVGPRRGPHMKGSHSIAIAVAKVPALLQRRLEETPI